MVTVGITDMDCIMWVYLTIHSSPDKSCINQTFIKILKLINDPSGIKMDG